MLARGRGERPSAPGGIRECSAMCWQRRRAIWVGVPSSNKRGSSLSGLTSSGSPLRITPRWSGSETVCFCCSATRRLGRRSFAACGRRSSRACCASIRTPTFAIFVSSRRAPRAGDTVRERFRAVGLGTRTGRTHRRIVLREVFLLALGTNVNLIWYFLFISLVRKTTHFDRVSRETGASRSSLSTSEATRGDCGRGGAEIEPSRVWCLPELHRRFQGIRIRLAGWARS